ncbi:MAG: FtsX-like permease family protein [Balneolaceae bacterium]
MKILLSISWRNIWRHPARSGVLMGAIIAGIWAGIFVSSWANGLIVQRIYRVIQEELTHVQIHHPDFLSEREPGMVLESVTELFDFLEKDERVRNFSARTLSDGMIQSPLASFGVQISGINRESETSTTLFHENLEEGEYLNSAVRNPVVLGRTLAEKLNVEIGNRIVLSFQDLENELISGSFNITGTFYTGQPKYDENRVFVRSEDLSNMISNNLVYHEIAIMLHDAEQSSEISKDLNREFDELSAEIWTELSPELRYMTGASESYSFYVMVVIMFALAFGILNTMLMAIFERMRELGMLMAIGMSKMRVFIMIMTESVILTLTGAVIGMLVAYGTINFYSERGIDLTSVGGDTLKEWGYDALVYPTVSVEEYVSITVLVIATALLAAIYPAIKALRLNPGEVVKE